MKGIFANRSALFHTGVLFYLFLLGLLVGTVIGIGIESVFITLPLPSTGSSQLYFYRTHLFQFCSSILMFLMPALITAYLCSHTPGDFLHIRKIKDARVFVLAALMMLFLSPSIDLTAFINSKLSLPEWMAPLENWFRETEDRLNELTQGLLSEKGFMPLIVNFLVIAALAGVTEEFLFRGALLSIVRKKITKPHVAIWLIAILFSAIHFQFSGFIPRMLLGAMLGYMLYWSKSIWIPVFAHFLNNAIAVTVSYIHIDHPDVLGLDTIHENMTRWEWIAYCAVAILGIMMFLLCAKGMKRISAS